MKSPWFYLPPLFIAVAGLCTMWFLQNFEKQEITSRSGMSFEARRNPLLAAEKFLTVLGKKAKSLKGTELFSNLPDTGDAILVRRMPAMLSQTVHNNLLTWVERGGHLLLVPSSYESGHPGAVNLMEQMDVEFYDEDETEKAVAQDETADKDSYLSTPHEKVIDIIVENVPLKIAVTGYRLLHDLNSSASFTINGSYQVVPTRKDGDDQQKYPITEMEHGAWLLQYKFGRGRISFLSEITPFANSNISKHDHASLLEWLVQDAEKVWFLYSSQAKPLPALIWENLPRFCIAVLVLFVLTIWRMQKRTGSFRLPEDDSHPNIMLHINAIGTYSWRNDKLTSILKENRQMVITQMTKRYLGTTGNSPKDHDLTTLARKSRIAPDILHLALIHESQSEQDLIQISMAMQTIQQQLYAKEKGIIPRNE